jgi:hypothetical protein
MKSPAGLRRTVSNYAYDKNGNLLSLQRYGKQGQLIDDIGYGYKIKSNRLDRAYNVAGNFISCRSSESLLMCKTAETTTLLGNLLSS